MDELSVDDVDNTALSIRFRVEDDAFRVRYCRHIRRGAYMTYTGIIAMLLGPLLG